MRVGGGPFLQGCDAEIPTCGADAQPLRTVHLAPFHIDTTEVTVQAYAACVAAAVCTEPGKTLHCNGARAGREDHPINCVDWHQAVTYCSWIDKRLPTEAEWERAARGTDGRTFPWGENTDGCSYAVLRDHDRSGCGLGTTWSVGVLPEGASPAGALDMGGNVAEWTADWYMEDYYSAAPSTNPRGPARGTERAVRGGCFSGESKCGERTYTRNNLWPGFRPHFVGFRCAADGTEDTGEHRP